METSDRTTILIRGHRMAGGRACRMAIRAARILLLSQARDQRIMAGAVLDSPSTARPAHRLHRLAAPWMEARTVRRTTADGRDSRMRGRTILPAAAEASRCGSVRRSCSSAMKRRATTRRPVIRRRGIIVRLRVTRRREAIALRHRALRGITAVPHRAATAVEEAEAVRGAMAVAADRVVAVEADRTAVIAKQEFLQFLPSGPDGTSQAIRAFFLSF